MIYFIQEQESIKAPIKIGYTAGLPQERLSSLQTGYPRRLHVLFTIDGNREDEIRLHEKWRHLRLGGEWFMADDDLLEYLKGLGCCFVAVTKQRTSGDLIRQIVREEVRKSIRKELYEFFGRRRDEEPPRVLKRRNINKDKRAAIETCLRLFMQDKTSWSGTTGDLFAALEPFKDGAFPNNPVWLGRILSLIKQDLIGIKIEPSCRPGNDSGWLVAREVA